MVKENNHNNLIYSIVIIIGMGVMTNIGINSIGQKIENLKKSLIESKIQEEDIFGKRGEKFKEKFYELPDGRRAYLEIDGKPVEQYLNIKR